MGKQTVDRLYIHILVAAAIGMLCLTLIPAANGLTPLGVRVIAIFLPVLYLWLTAGTDWTCWLALILIVFTGVMTPAQVFAGSYGSSLIITVIGMMAFSKVLVDTGVIDTVVKWFVTRELVRGHPYRFIAVLMVVEGLASIVMNISAMLLIFIALIAAVCKEIGYQKGDSFYTALMLGLFWVSNAYNAGSPLGHALPLVLMSTASAAGYDVSIAQWMAVGIPAATLITAAAILTICVIWKPEASKFMNYDLGAHRKEVKPFTPEGKVTLALLIFVILYWVIPAVFPGILPPAAQTLYDTWGSTAPVIVALALLCIIHVKGKPITTFRRATSTTGMTTITFIGCVTVLGSAVSSAETGISVWLSNILSPMVSSMSVFAFITLLSLVFITMTNFISNTVCMMLYYNLAIPIVAAAGLPTAGITVIICIIASFASLVPSAATTAPFFFDSGHITVKNSWKWNVAMIAAAWALVSFIVYPLVV